MTELKTPVEDTEAPNDPLQKDADDGYQPSIVASPAMLKAWRQAKNVKLAMDEYCRLMGVPPEQLP